MLIGLHVTTYLCWWHYNGWLQSVSLCTCGCQHCGRSCNSFVRVATLGLGREFQSFFFSCPTLAMLVNRLYLSKWIQMYMGSWKNFGFGKLTFLAVQLGDLAENWRICGIPWLQCPEWDSTYTCLPGCNHFVVPGTSHEHEIVLLVCIPQ